MVLGMVTVFLFLILMVFILNIQSKMARKFFPEKVTSKTSTVPVPEQTTSKDNKALVAAITAAIQTFRTTKV